MNVQVSPPAPKDELHEEELHEEDLGELRPARKYLLGGAALALVLGGFWYFTHGTGEIKPRRAGAAPVKVATVEKRDMAVIERTIGTVVANSTVSGEPPGQRPAHQGLFQ